MSQPVLDQTTWGWTCDRDPTSTEPNDTGILQYGNLWRNSTNNKLWFCLDSGDYNNNDLVWGYLTTLLNYSPSLPSLSYTNRETPSFNTAYLPSSTNNVFVVATYSISLTILQNSTIEIQIDSGSGYSTIATHSLSSIAITNTSSLSFIVPSNSSYKIVSSGTGTNTLLSIMELVI